MRRSERVAGLCAACAGSVRRVPEFRTEGGLLVRAGGHHDGVARALVHRLKYQGEVGAARPLAALMAAVIEPTPGVLVPVPRALLRRARFGIDPAVELAQRLGLLLGWPVRDVLQPAPWWPRHAGKPRSGRASSVPRFRLLRDAGAPTILVDDVVTTGATAAAAAEALGHGPGRVIAAVAAGKVP